MLGSVRYIVNPIRDRNEAVLGIITLFAHLQDEDDVDLDLDAAADFALPNDEVRNKFD